MDDAKIVQLYWDRNEQAIPATADKYGRYCTSIANNILGNNEDAVAWSSTRSSMYRSHIPRENSPQLIV